MEQKEGEQYYLHQKALKITHTKIDGLVVLGFSSTSANTLMYSKGHYTSQSTTLPQMD